MDGKGKGHSPKGAPWTWSKDEILYQIGEREKRIARIMPHWKDLMNGEQPRTSKAELYTLLSDLKEEGNMKFKEEMYNDAWVHYRNALFIAKSLETQHYEDVDKDFVSALFSNRAFCSIKMGRYFEALEDANLAIDVSLKKNTKAYYRKAVALKGLKKYKEALETAREGQKRAESGDFGKGFQDLISELSSKVHSAKAEKVEPVRLPAEASANSGSVEKEEVDESWLLGTNVFVSKKASDVGKDNKKKKNKKKNVSLGVKLSGADEDDTGDEDEEEDEDESLITTIPSANRFDALNNLGSVSTASTRETEASKKQPEVQTKSPSRNRDLSDFDLSGMGQQQLMYAMDASANSPRSQQGQERQGNPWQQVVPQSPRRSQQYQQPSYNTNNVQSQEAGVVPSRGLLPTPLPPFPPPYDSWYDYRFACRNCFQQIGEGVNGYRLSTVQNHLCEENFLLMKLKQGNGPWLKIRPRPVNVHFVGTYKLCRHFLQQKPCNVGEARCTFAHNDEEMELWAIDREGGFSIADFISKHTTNILRERSLQAAMEAKRQQQVYPSSHQQGYSSSHQQGYSSSHQQGYPALHQQGYPASHQQRYPASHQQGYPASHQQGYQASYVHGGLRQSMGRGRVMLTPGGQYPGHGMMNNPNQGMRIFRSSSSQGYGRGEQDFSYLQNMQNRIVQMPVSGGEKGQRIEFPLQQTHTFKLVCRECLKPAGVLGTFVHAPPPQHNCEENMLAVMAKGGNTYVRVRDRRNHRPFYGSYVLCTHYTGLNPRVCKVGEDLCSFAHNHEEQKLWNLEKDGRFNIMEFTLQHKSHENLLSVEKLLTSYGGEFRYLCHSCFYGQPPRISYRSPLVNHCTSPAKHDWEENKLLVHMSPSGITTIGKKKFTGKQAYFKFCYMKQFCQLKSSEQCYFAHSLVERDVWLLERDSSLTQDDIVKQSAQIVNKRNPVGNKAQSIPLAADTPGQAGAPFPEVKPPVVCNYKVLYVCGPCFRQGNIKTKNKDQDRCAAGLGHQWEANKVCLLQGPNKIIRALPKRIPTGLKFVICKNLSTRRSCDFARGGLCQFAHSNEEIEVWKWQVQNNVLTLDELVAASTRTQEENAAKSKIVKGHTSVTVQKAGPSRPAIVPSDMVQSVNYCSYCGVQCNSKKQWDDHTTSDRHVFNVNSDKEHQWNYRQPPWGISTGGYELCHRHLNGGTCKYSNMPDMYNSCRYAHSQEELDEWKERYQWRQMKKQMAKQQKVYSYMDELLENYENSDSPISVLADQLPYVNMEVSDELIQYKQQKKSEHLWSFTLEPDIDRKLAKVALLYNKDRLHFALHSDDLSKNCQVADGEFFEEEDEKGQLSYRVEVHFTGGMFGSFSQWVVFDFGVKPALYRKLQVEVGTEEAHEKVKELREKLTFDRWTLTNREIVKIDYNLTDELTATAMRQYKEPSSADAVITQDSVIVELNRHNYEHKMHKLLEVEELTRSNMISEFNLLTTLELTDSIKEDTFIFACPGELFARVPLNDQLSEDTNAGKLVLTSVTTVLLAPKDSSSHKVYEAIIVQKENFDYDGRGKDYIYMCLSAKCCQQLGLKAGKKIEVQIQFQMNRALFSLMHFALDHLKNVDLVFPDVTKVNPVWNVVHNLKLSSSVLNDDQMKVVQHIVAERTGYTPPLIVYGPFGTGKTETLAQSVMILLNERPDARVLICTHSNSAADLYLLRHLDPYVKKNSPNMKIRRVYFRNRRVNTVNPAVKKYCLLSDDKQSFVDPTAEDIREQRVVIVTLSTSLLLTVLNLKGHFTHILVDEGAQALECETIMPFTLADENTCMVIAGDHMQMSPKVYSPEARRQGFHKSFLERLYTHYDKYSHQSDCGHLKVLLKKNYRSKMEILRFISAVFYGGPEKLESMADLPDVPNLSPLNFYAAQGSEIQDDDSTSFYNLAEVEEVADRVEELWNTWPQEWGDKRPDTIGVVAPYTDQVTRIRRSLRRKNPQLGQVIVERVMNVQGKEFRALFISTVRSRHLLQSSPAISAAAECDGEGGDYGFLSDQKLLNTAFTRAQSFVGIVGDHVALCALGDCMTVWRTYLKHCQNMKSIYPQNLTLDAVKTAVISMMNSDEGRMYQEAQMQLTYEEEEENAESGSAAREAILTENVACNGTSAVEGGDVMVNGNSEGQALVNGMASMAIGDDVPLSATTASGPLGLKQANGGREGVGSAENDWEMYLEFPPSEVLGQLAKESNRHMLQSLREKGMVFDSEEDQLIHHRSLKYLGCKGHISIYQATSWLTPQILNEYKDVYLMDEIRDNEVSSLPDFTTKQLKGLVDKMPSQFKQCIIHRDSSEIYGEVLGKESDIHKVVIGSSTDCKSACNLDDVVVEVKAHVGSEIVGRVAGILKRARDPLIQLFVCQVNEESTGILTPINSNFPIIYNLESLSRASPQPKGDEVCVYAIQNSEHQKVVFDHHESINLCDISSKLFVVKFAKWEPSLDAPVGIVIGVLPRGDTIPSGLRILSIEYSIARKFSVEAMIELQHLYPPSYSPPQPVISDRLDFREKMTFAFKSPGSLYIDNCYSIEQQPDGTYLLGVHVTDVAFFVKKGSYLDEEARKKMNTFHCIGQEAAGIIPEQLQANHCSIQEGQDRLVMSVLLTVQLTGQIIQAQLRKSVVNTKYVVENSEAEKVLKGVSDVLPNNIATTLKFVHHLAKMFAKIRNGNSSLFNPALVSSPDAPEVQFITKELMIMANYQLSRILVEIFPRCTPLLCQDSPRNGIFDNWKLAAAPLAKNSVAFAQYYHPVGGMCACVGHPCGCAEEACGPVEDLEYLDVQTSVWGGILQATQLNDVVELCRLITTPHHHPQLAVAAVQMQKMQSKPKYACADVKYVQQHNFGLNLPYYMSFTAPTQTYMDIVTQHLIGALLESKPNPYTEEEMGELCEAATHSLVRVANFKEDAQTLCIAQAFKEKPLMTAGIISSLNQDNVKIILPFLAEVKDPEFNIPLQQVGNAQWMTTQEGKEKTLVVQWMERIYDMQLDPLSGRENDAPLVLNPNPYIIQIPTSDWQKIIQSLIKEDFSNVNQVISAAGMRAKFPMIDDGYVTEVSSEMKKGLPFKRQECEFSLVLKPSGVITVQVSADVVQGMLRPVVQLISLTPNLDICLEHARSPVKCFTSAAAKYASKQNYTDVNAYQKAWLPALAVEAAEIACESGESFILHHVNIRWQVNDVPTGVKAVGMFTMPLSFCKQRQMSFVCELENRMTGGEVSVPYEDYLCIRYQNIAVASPSNYSHLYGNDPVCWVLHCVTTNLTVSPRQDKVVVNVVLNQTSMDIPPVFLTPESASLPCTLQWISKPKHLRNTEMAIKEMVNSSQLVKDIALGNPAISTGVAPSVVNQMMEKLFPGCNPLNTEQHRALSLALSQSFTVIQGCAGTGKTELAARLAVMFVDMNCPQQSLVSSTAVPAQVLLCAWSENSLDNLMKCLKSLGPGAPRMVRVYNDSIVRQAYPMPRRFDGTEANMYDLASGDKTDVDKELALHHFIRHPSNSKCTEIRVFDLLFKEYPQEVTEEQLMIYEDKVLAAERDELSKVQLILCTIATSKKLIARANIRQVIIDDAEMCTEPETIAPLVYCNPRQVVLVGDIQQMKPRVWSKTARKLGLEVSLCERYSQKAVQLKTQYRMHQGICRFLSPAIYKGLLCGTEDLLRPSNLSMWPAGPVWPVLVHSVLGEAETVTVNTGGNKKKCSRKNDLETKHVVDYCAQLVTTYGISPGSIVVLSCYEGQKEEISNQLMQKELADISTQTVLQAQGKEWDYAVFSTVCSLPAIRQEHNPTIAWKEEHLGPLADHHMVTVALTRAKKGLIIIGNTGLLECDGKWRQLLQSYRQLPGAVVL
ncbi:helicase with zinc finger domain 2 isoform X2 [Lingula anatina]|uniref:Helicase with zinc finger domain 2 isoform X2 n=1 Tax=Lingula anatina TaxID=7574 RepID=A0A1S3K4I1_LINAN|nr:helicase with zinc finger domain 2 isoform X2 [Lingula anatina]|eukprot:XP_013417543.1 helicase with zinc finger domain 2 isoform X2 [Lingula anatina]